MTTDSSSLTAVLKSFQTFWDTYPKMGNRDRTLALFLDAIRQGADPERIIAAAKQQRAVNRCVDPRYITAADRWLEVMRWD